MLNNSTKEDKMFAPKSVVKDKKNPELAALTEKAHKAYRDDSLTCKDANAIIKACREEYMEKGGCSGGCVAYRGKDEAQLTEPNYDENGSAV